MQPNAAKIISIGSRLSEFRSAAAYGSNGNGSRIWSSTSPRYSLSTGTFSIGSRFCFATTCRYLPADSTTGPAPRDDDPRGRGPRRCRDSSTTPVRRGGDEPRRPRDSSWPRRRRDSSPRNVHVAAAASPRLVSTGPTDPSPSPRAARDVRINSWTMGTMPAGILSPFSATLAEIVAAIAAACAFVSFKKATRRGGAARARDTSRRGFFCSFWMVRRGRRADVSYLRCAPVSAEYPRRSRGVAATRRSPRNIHVAAAASPRPVCGLSARRKYAAVFAASAICSSGFSVGVAASRVRVTGRGAWCTHALHVARSKSWSWARNMAQSWGVLWLHLASGCRLTLVLLQATLAVERGASWGHVVRRACKADRGRPRITR